MSDFQIDDIGKLQQFATLIDELLAEFKQDSVLPHELVPDPTSKSPNMGHQPGPGSSGSYSGFTDAVNLFLSYDTHRRQLVGDPGQVMSDPASSSIAAFVDGLNHLSATAKSIYQNYDKAQQTEKLSIDQIQAALNASPTQQPGTAG